MLLCPFVPIIVSLTKKTTIYLLNFNSGHDQSVNADLCESLADHSRTFAYHLRTFADVSGRSRTILERPQRSVNDPLMICEWSAMIRDSTWMIRNCLWMIRDGPRMICDGTQMIRGSSAVDPRWSVNARELTANCKMHKKLAKSAFQVSF